MTLTHFAIIAVCAYLLGSLSFAIIVSKLTLGKDIRNYGSGNAGLTNAYRTMGAKKTLLVLLGDMLGLGLVEHLVVEGGRAIEAGERVLADLALQRGDLLIQAVDLIGDMLEEDIDLVDVVALAIDGEALVMDFSRGDSHLCIPSSDVRECAGAHLEQVYQQTYTEL